MRYVVDHDFHIHSRLSICSKHPEQTPENILKYAEKNGLRKIVLTDHFWDESVPMGIPPLEDGTFPKVVSFYQRQGYPHIKENLPLPQGKNTKFLFGAEAEITYKHQIGVSERVLSELDFIIIPPTHLHMTYFAISEEDAKLPEARARVLLGKMRAILSAPLPFKKIGIAHFACSLIAPTHDEYLEVLRLLPEKELKEIFTRAADCGVGIELNQKDFAYADSEADIVLRPFLIAKSAGCKFYLGSDSHNPDGFKNAIARFNRAIDELSLKETDKFIL